MLAGDALGALGTDGVYVRLGAGAPAQGDRCRCAVAAQEPASVRLAARPSAVPPGLDAAGLPIPDRCQRGVLVKDPNQGADLVLVKTTGLRNSLVPVT